MAAAARELTRGTGGGRGLHVGWLPGSCDGAGRVKEPAPTAGAPGSQHTGFHDMSSELESPIHGLLEIFGPD